MAALRQMALPGGLLAARLDGISARPWGIFPGGLARGPTRPALLLPGQAASHQLLAAQAGKLDARHVAAVLGQQLGHIEAEVGFRFGRKMVRWGMLLWVIRPGYVTIHSF